MSANRFARWLVVAAFALLSRGLPAHAACTAGNPNAQVIEYSQATDFTVNANGTATHAKTGLTWKQCAEGSNPAGCSGTATAMGWASALDAANAANAAAFAGYTDWRLPNSKELESIIEFCGHSPAINRAVFPATPASLPFWSGTSYLPDPSRAWTVSFGTGNTLASDKSGGNYVRLVRGGRSLDSFARFNTVTYEANGSTGGSPPTDGATYSTGDLITVSGNSGGLVKAGYSFAGWNTASDGTGSSYVEGNTLAMGSGSLRLYARWSTGGYTAPSPTGTGNITASLTGGGPSCQFTLSQFIPLSGNAASPPAGSAPLGVIFPHGLFNFVVSGCMPGSALSLTITYPQSLPPDTQYWKYGPTSDNTSPHWYALGAANNVSIVGNTASFTIIDGGLGDDDLVANGTIGDQGGPGTGGGGGTGGISIPTLSEWAMLLLLLSLGMTGACTLRRGQAGRWPPASPPSP